MNPLKITAIAFSTYSVIPVPSFKWSEEEMHYALCAFPLIGAVLGGAFYVWALFCQTMELSHVLFAAVAVFLPIALTGGIHLDGFCDVSDALASHQSREKKLEILKDSHIGAFAAIKCSAYLLLQFGIYSQLGPNKALPVAIGFVLSRALSALMASLLPKASKSGMLVTYAGQGHNRPTAIVSAAAALVSAAGIICFSPLCGTLIVAFSALWCLIYKRQAVKNFGGVTGDTAGYFLQICELLIPVAVTLSSLIERSL